MYMADTNVLSVSTPSRRERHAALADWMDARSHALFLSVVTVAEISAGTAKPKRTGSDSESTMKWP